MEEGSEYLFRSPFLCEMVPRCEDTDKSDNGCKMRRVSSTKSLGQDVYGECKWGN